ncbi:class I adenylate-forming enzyme family protein [Nocardia asteroides]|uniref:class I adenylate-forming enzyme family protein n=1 Tax=Nocardia asteroides TaxID=1824 RepID=UPI00340A0B54
MLERAAKLHAGRIAVLDGSTARTFSELAADVEVVATGLRAIGISPGDRVIVSVSTGLKGIAVLYALSQIGAVSVPINEYWTPVEVESVIRRSDAVYAVSDSRLGEPGQPLPVALGMVDLLRRPGFGVIDDSLEIRWQRPDSRHETRASNPEDTAMLLFTSGSTSTPKGVLITHAGLVGAAHYVGLTGEISAEDRMIHMLPHYHVGGVVDGILGMHLVGAATIPIRFNTERILQIFEHSRATVLVGFDSMIDAVLAAATYDRRRHPYWTTAMITGSEQTYDRLRDAGVNRIVTGYGMTETSGLAAGTRPSQPDEIRRAGHWLPVPGVDIKVIDPVTNQPVREGMSGELTIRGWSLFGGYVDGEKHCDEAGYFRTGDRVRLHPGHTFSFDGRLKDMVKTGGENVACHEVEEFLVSHIDAVRSAVVVGVSDDRWGQIVVALVEFQPGSTLSEDALRGMCSGKLSAFKIPKRVIAVSPGTWPLMASGKVDRHALTAQATEYINPSPTAFKS